MVARARAPRSRSASAVRWAADSASEMASSLSETQKATGDSWTAGETTSTSAPSRSSSGSARRTASASTGSVARTSSLTRLVLPQSRARKRASDAGEVLAAVGLELGAVARHHGLGEGDELEDLGHGPARADVPAGEREGDVDGAQPVAVRGVGVHRHDDLGLDLRGAELDLALGVLEDPDGELRVRVAHAVLHDGVGTLEARADLVVGDDVPEQLAEVRVQVVGVLEV